MATTMTKVSELKVLTILVWLRGSGATEKLEDRGRNENWFDVKMK